MEIRVKKAADKDKIFRQLFMYLNEKKGGELIISYQLEYYEKNLVSVFVWQLSLTVYG